MSDITKEAPARMGGRIKNDIIFLAVILAVIALLGLLFFLCRGEGDTVKVVVDGKTVSAYPLSVDREVLLGEGDKTNLLIIKNGEAWVAEATCRDGICAAHPPISRNGESIACLPHDTVIVVKSSNDAPDIVV